MERTRDLLFKFPLLRGEDVRAVQLALTTLNIQPPCGAADGIFGPGTAETVRAFQRGRGGLRVDGIVGRDTWAALFSSAASSSSPLVRETSRLVSAPPAATPAAPAPAPAPTPSPTSAGAGVLPEGTIGAMREEPPGNPAFARQVRDWLVSNFGPQIDAAVQGKPYDARLIHAIACKEAAIYWFAWTSRMDVSQVLSHCVFDASGDVASSPRSAFPPNTAAFRDRYGDEFTDMLIREANAMRGLRGMGDADFIYKGYGLFQYDLQHVVNDEAFFRNRQWGDFTACLDRVVSELDRKAAGASTLRDIARRYNGSGARAEEYANHILQIRTWLATGGAAAAAPVPAPMVASGGGGGPYVADDPESLLGQSVGSGHCVPYVQEVAGAPHTSQWQAGQLVKGAGDAVARGTAIATFDPDGTYGNHVDGRSHAAIYLSQDDVGLTVLDQWRGTPNQPVHQRVIRFGGATPANDGDQFRVVL